MNCLSLEKKIQVLNCLVEKVIISIRSTERMTGIHRDTIIRLLTRVGSACAGMLDKWLVNVRVEEIEDPNVPNSGIRLPPWVSNGEAAIGPGMKDARLREPGVGDLRDPYPRGAHER